MVNSRKDSQKSQSTTINQKKNSSGKHGNSKNSSTKSVKMLVGKKCMRSDETDGSGETSCALDVRSWKAIHTKDRGTAILWSDIIFPHFRSRDSQISCTSALTTSRDHSDRTTFTSLTNSQISTSFSNTYNNNSICLSEPIPVSNAIYSDTLEADVIVGKGTFGTVIRAVWRKPTKTHLRFSPSSTISDSNTVSMEDIDVAIKILTTSSSSSPFHERIEFESLRYRAYKEAVIMMMAKQKLSSTAHIIEYYGIIEGTLPAHISALLRLPDNEQCICLVSRYEGGGSLHSLISKSNKAKMLIPMKEKLRLLHEIMMGLHEMHSAGIIHADIKPENCLLSNHEPSQVRLADFGLSMLLDMDAVNDSVSDDNHCSSINHPEQHNSATTAVSNDISRKGLNKKNSSVVNQTAIDLDATALKLSTLANTTRTTGTMTYCAPEMLVNPYMVTMNVDELSVVAKPSRRTDMYAFGVLCWQLLSQRRPFYDVQGEVMLCSQVHSGYRPPLTKLPKETPSELVKMIALCWDLDRSKRPTALECIGILNVCREKFSINISPSLSRDECTIRHSNSPSRPCSSSLVGSINSVVPLPSFDRPKSTSRSQSLVSESDKQDSMKTMPIDYATMKNMLKIRIFNSGSLTTSRSNTHSDPSCSTRSISNQGERVSSIFEDDVLRSSTNGNGYSRVKRHDATAIDPQQLHEVLEGRESLVLNSVASKNVMSCPPKSGQNINNERNGTVGSLINNCSGNKVILQPLKTTPVVVNDTATATQSSQAVASSNMYNTIVTNGIGKKLSSPMKSLGNLLSIDKRGGESQLRGEFNAPLTSSRSEISLLSTTTASDSSLSTARSAVSTQTKSRVTENSSSKRSIAGRLFGTFTSSRNLLVSLDEISEEPGLETKTEINKSKKPVSLLHKSAEYVISGMSSSGHNRESSHSSEQDQAILASQEERKKKQHQVDKIQHLNAMRLTLNKQDSSALLKNASSRVRKGSEVVLRTLPPKSGPNISLGPQPIQEGLLLREMQHTG